MINPRLESLAKYMAKSDPRSVNKLGYKYGFIPALTDEGREGMLYRGIMEEGENFIQDIMRHHPDKEAIIAANFVGSEYLSQPTNSTPGHGNYPQVGATTKTWSADGSTVVAAQGPNFTVGTVILLLIVAFLLYQILM